jgi:formylglycine-generating enzyme required for sulfatase activity
LQDAQAYSRWLSLHGLPGAHVCDDREWERAARGADGRDFTTGETLLASDVNIDETYGREPSSFGPDEVGSHPASDSVFGVQDMVGNAMEMVISVEGFDAASIRGGSWYYDEWSARLPARFPLDKTTRSPMVGFRICAPIDATGRGNP